MSFHQFDGWCIRHRKVKLVYEPAAPPYPGPGHRCLFDRAAIETTATKIRGPSWSPLNRSFGVTVMVCIKHGGFWGNAAVSLGVGQLVPHDAAGRPATVHRSRHPGRPHLAAASP